MFFRSPFTIKTEQEKDFSVENSFLKADFSGNTGFLKVKLNIYKNKILECTLCQNHNPVLLIEKHNHMLKLEIHFFLYDMFLMFNPRLHNEGMLNFIVPHATHCGDIEIPVFVRCWEV